jgi:molybdate transport system substrate-binding protein
MSVRPLLMILIALASLLPQPASAQISCGAPSGAASPAASPAAMDYPAFPEDGGKLRIMAAASLTDAFSEMEAMLEERHPGLEITVETAGSQTLVTQLQQGAEADVLATANTSTMQLAVESGLVDGEPVAFAQNRLVIATPENNPAGIGSIADLANDGVSLVLAGEDVPAGIYAREALCAWVSEPGTSEDFLVRVDANVVSEEPDVRHVLTKLILGEADAGIVYASDAMAAERAGTPLTVIELPEGIVAPAIYPIAPVTEGDTDLANAFIGFVFSEEGRAILVEYGFS